MLRSLTASDYFGAPTNNTVNTIGKIKNQIHLKFKQQGTAKVPPLRVLPVSF